jgi:hypothetical protein
MTVAYIVTRGCYSDYSISSVFSSESLAQAYIDKHLSKADYQIETYNVDEDKDVVMQTFWEYEIEADSGNYYKRYKADTESMRMNGEKALCNPFRSRSSTRRRYGVIVISSQSTVSFEHAKKVAAEARQCYLRTGILPSEDYL